MVMNDTERYMLATYGLMVFGVLFVSQLAYSFTGYKLAYYFQMITTLFWLIFSMVMMHKVNKRKQEVEKNGMEERNKSA